MDFGMKTPLQIDAEGYAHPPGTPGIGVDLDWNFIDDCTLKKL
jgi:L-alanine-DL-glutamate epimerase-like enolase superfamily enzyme